MVQWNRAKLDTYCATVGDSVYFFLMGPFHRPPLSDTHLIEIYVVTNNNVQTCTAHTDAYIRLCSIMKLFKYILGKVPSSDKFSSHIIPTRSPNNRAPYAHNFMKKTKVIRIK